MFNLKSVQIINENSVLTFFLYSIVFSLNEYLIVILYYPTRDFSDYVTFGTHTHTHARAHTHKTNTVLIPDHWTTNCRSLTLASLRNTVVVEVYNSKQSACRVCLLPLSGVM